MNLHHTISKDWKSANGTTEEKSETKSNKATSLVPGYTTEQYGIEKCTVL